MRKYVIWVEENGQRSYIKVTDQGTVAVSDKKDATPLPNRVLASSIVAAIKPGIKKQGFDVQIGMDII